MNKIFVIFEKLIGRFDMRNFLKGYSTILDLFPSEKPPYIEIDKFQVTGFEDDEKALRKDWELIGKDLGNAIDEYRNTRR